MDSSSRPFLVNLLRSICQDAMFALASSQEVVEEQLGALSKRRGPVYDAVGRGGAVDTEDWRAWAVVMSAVVAPVRPPEWMPMHDLVHSVSLEAGARGMRSLFTSRPSEKEVQRTRRIGSLAMRTLGVVLGADGPLRPDEELLRQSLLAALGLPEDDARLLSAEKPMAPQAIEISGEIDPKLARALIRGAWQAAFGDGIEPREDEAVHALASRFGVSPEDAEALRQEVRARIDLRRSFGAAAVDAIRYVLGDEPEAGPKLGRLTAELALPAVHRPEAMAAIEHAGPVILARRHSLERAQREACLSLAWFAALWTDPSATRAAELAARHDRIASDLSARPEGAVARSMADSFVQNQLVAFAVTAGL
jgi:tellurite resistance protein